MGIKDSLVALSSALTGMATGRRMDSGGSIVSGTTGIGGDQDKGANFQVNMERRSLSQVELDQAYKHNGMVSRIVDTLPNDAVRKRWQVVVKEEDGSTNHASANIMRAFNKDQHVFAKVNEVLRWARKDGGAAILLVTSERGITNIEIGSEDGEAEAPELEEVLQRPLDLKKLDKITNLVVLDGKEIDPEEWCDNMYDPNFREVQRWNITPQTKGSMGSYTNVHHSRVIYFPGSKLSPSKRFEGAAGLDESVVDVVWDQVRNWGSTGQAVNTLVQQMQRTWLKVAGMGAQATGDEGVLFQMKMRVIALSQSLLGMTLLNADDELHTEMSTITGVREADEISRRALQAVSRMPATKLFGDAPAGLNTDGNASKENWGTEVESAQMLMTPQLQYLYTVAFSAKEGPTQGKVPEFWDLKFNALDKPTDKEQAETNKRVAEFDGINIKNKVYTAGHVTRSRYGEAGFNMDLTPVPEADIKALEEEQAAATEQADALALTAAENPDQGGDDNSDKKASPVDKKAADEENDLDS